MKEKEYFQTLILERAVDDTKIKTRACIPVSHKAVAWKRAAAIAAICAAALIAAVFAIPSARAEVLGWFGMRSTAEYLSTDAKDRPSIPELDALIVTPAPETQGQTAEASATAEPSVPTAAPVLNTEGEKPDNDWLWQEIAENFSAHIGETMFDGERLYVMIDFDGLSGYPVFEYEWHGELPAGAQRLSLLSERIAPENVRCFYDDNANLKQYLSGEKELWIGPDTILDLTLRNGEKTGLMCGEVVMVPRAIDIEFQQELIREYGIDNPFSHEAASNIMQRVLEHFRKNGLKACAYFILDNGTATKLIDGSGESVFSFIDFETGIMQATASFRVLLDHGMRNVETKILSEIGPVSIHMRAYQDLTERQITTVTEKVSLSGVHAFGSFLQAGFEPYRIQNLEASLDGVTLTVENPGYLNLLGLHNIRLRAALPADWSDAYKETFLHSLAFTIELDDARFYTNIARYPNEDGSYTLYLQDIDGIPFEQFPKIRSVRIIPTLTYCKKIEIYETVPPGEVPGTPLEVIPMGPNDVFRSEALKEGTFAVFDVDEPTCFPEWTLTLRVE